MSGVSAQQDALNVRYGWKVDIEEFAIKCDHRSMSDILYVFQGEGIAERAANRRTGARHALIVFMSAANLDDARGKASSRAAANGWSHVTFTRGAAVDVEVAELEEVYLRAAFEDAIETGSAVVSYLDELSPHS